MRNQSGLKPSPRAAVRRPAGGGRRSNRAGAQLEPLESRRLFTVTLNNGLAPTDPNYFQVTLGAGDSVVPGSALLGQTNVVKEYTAFLDIGQGNVIDFSNVQTNQGTATTAVAGTAPNTAVSTLVLNTGTTIFNGKTVQNTITVDVTAALIPGATTLTMTYALSGSQFENMQGVRLFQYDDAAVSPASDNVVQVSGSILTGDLKVAAINPDFFISTAQQNGTDSAGSTLTGWGAGLFPSLRQTIAAGGFNPPVTGTNTLTATTTPGFGATFGTGDVTTVLAYSITASQNARVQTVLNCSVATPQVPVMQVLGFDTSTAAASASNTKNFIPSGDTIPKATDGTDFGTLSIPTTHQFEVRNIGGTILSLPNIPEVLIGGPNAGDFVVTLQPLPQVGTGLSSTFSITFEPQGPGRRQATVVIYNNDFTHNPYTFAVAGGTGTTVPPDAFEPDNNSQQASTIPTDGTLQNHTINAPNDVDWAKFTITQASAVNIQTNGPIGDTRMWLYGAGDTTNALLFNDNNGINLFSQIYDPALPAGTYYVKVDSNGENNVIPAYTLSVQTTPALSPGGGGGGQGQFATLAAGVLTVTGTALADTIDVSISGANVAATLNGVSLFFPVNQVGAVQVTGGAGNDVITIEQGVPSATVRGGGGNDSITGGNAGNALYGGAGDDTIVGGAGNDLIFGGAGNDLLSGGPGDDTIYGQDGNDTVNGNAGNDVLFGGAGDDMIDGGPGNDALYGRAGNDTLTGGDGNDQMFGGAGDDSFFAKDATADTIDGGAGNNFAQVDAGIDQVLNVQTII